MPSKSYTFSLETETFENFKNICDKEFLNKSRILESFLRSFNKEPEKYIKMLKENAKDD